MVTRFFKSLPVVLVILALLLTSCSSGTETASKTDTSTKTAASTTSTSKTTAASTTSTPEAKWYDKFGTPQYGGEMVLWGSAVNGGSFDPDVGFGMGAGVPGPAGLYREHFVTMDWDLDRDIWAYQTGFTPLNYYDGAIAESWQQPSPDTVIMHIREGVYWHDVPPVNGREFTADDVKYCFDRILGTGSGFTVPNPFIAGMYSAVKSVTATDKYTVEFKLKSPSIMGLFQVLSDQVGLIAKEWDEQADPTDWKSVSGTGAFILSDFQVGTLMAYTRNPNYWGYDPRYPENQLPYLDSVKVLAIPEINTALAALRTGKIDIINDPMGGPSWQQVDTLKKTNPDLQTIMVPHSAEAIVLRCDHEPFTDIRVRTALQMAIDLPTIAKSYYGGNATGEPVGIVSTFLTGWCVPFDEWPADLKAEYTYNPTKAKELLAEAGYPDGFETNIVVPIGEDMALVEVVKSMFNDIGVDMTINAYDMPTARGMFSSGNHDQMAWNEEMGNPGPVTNNLNARRSGDGRNYSFNNDPVYDALLEKMAAATTLEDFQAGVIEADMYSLEQHWSVNFTSTVGPMVWQSWLQGYSGEFGFGQPSYYLWIDKSLKK